MTARLGIDKVALLIPVDAVSFDPTFASRADIDNRRDPVTGEQKCKRVLYRDEAGQAVTGKLLKFCPEYQFTVKPGDLTGESSIILLQWSGAAFRENNVEALGKDEVFETALAVQKDLKAAGVTLDPSKGLLYRLDITPTFPLSEPVPHYAPIFGGIGVRKRVNKIDFGGTGFYLGNDSWEAAFYDKYEQLKANYGMALNCAKNTLRPELRLLNSQKLRSVLPVRNVPELLEKWGDMTGIYRGTMQKEIFKDEYKIDRPAASDWAGLAAQARQKQRNKWQLFKSDALPAFMVRDMGLERAKSFVAESFGFDPETEAGKRQIDRMHKELSLAAFHLATEGESATGIGMRELYRELKSKVLAARV